MIVIADFSEANFLSYSDGCELSINEHLTLCEVFRVWIPAYAGMAIYFLFLMLTTFASMPSRV